MKLIFLVPLILISSCKQYHPKETAVQSSLGSVATLAGSECKNKNLVYITSEPSSITWSIGQSSGTTTAISARNPATGSTELTKGLLNQMKGLISFNVVATSTGDPIRDRVVQEAILGMSNSSPFRFNLQSLNGAATAIANGATVDMKVVGVLEIGERKSPVSMPVQITEKDGIYSMKGAVSINARQPRPAVNSIDLDDKLKIVEAVLSTQLGSSIDFQFDLNLKNNCLVK